MRASQIVPRRVRWLWHEHIPEGELTLVAGAEGLGKSTALYRLAADTTRGRLVGESLGTPHPVIVVATEDSWEHTIVPRLQAQEADLDLVMRVDAVEVTDDKGVPFDVPIFLPRDLDALENAVVEHHVALVVLDPLMSRIGVELDTHKDAEVRRALEPLVNVAHTTRCAFVGILHFNKGASPNVLDRVMGSKAFTAVARAVLVVIRDPGDPNVRLLGITKSNLGPDELPAWKFRIDTIVTGHDPDDGGPIIAARYLDLGRHAVSVRAAVEMAEITARQDKRETTTAIGRAERWLRELLEPMAGPVLATWIEERGERDGHALRTVQRAATNIGVEKSKAKGEEAGPWLWSLARARGL